MHQAQHGIERVAAPVVEQYMPLPGRHLQPQRQAGLTGLQCSEQAPSLQPPRSESSIYSASSVTIPARNRPRAIAIGLHRSGRLLKSQPTSSVTRITRNIAARACAANAKPGWGMARVRRAP